MYLIVVIDRAEQRWMSDPEIVQTKREADDAEQRKREGTVGSLSVAVYEMRKISERPGEMDE